MLGQDTVDIVISEGSPSMKQLLHGLVWEKDLRSFRSRILKVKGHGALPAYQPRFGYALFITIKFSLELWPLGVKMAPNFSLLDNPVFRDFAFFSAVLAAKCLVMSFLTSRMRLSTKVLFLQYSGQTPFVFYNLGRYVQLIFVVAMFSSVGRETSRNRLEN